MSLVNSCKTRADGAVDGGETVREGTKEAEKHPDHL